MQVKHVAASNYASLTGGRFPADFLGGNGPENLKAKTDILCAKFLRDSFALGAQGRGIVTY